MDALRFVRGFQLARGKSPTLQEIATGMGGVSKSPTFRLVCAIQERGLVRTGYQSPRSIELLTDIAIPRAPDGAPLYFVPIGNGQ
ncbi:MAG: hypothetical protein U0988_11185 [Allopontixanthobacter sp.]|nr:hypothetical protein [Allopontixanthobacter sp.]